MNTVTYLYPAPYSPLPITHPAFGYQSSDHTDIAETFRRHAPIQDDYELTERTAHIDLMGEFPK